MLILIIFNYNIFNQKSEICNTIKRFCNELPFTNFKLPILLLKLTFNLCNRLIEYKVNACNK